MNTIIKTKFGNAKIFEGYYRITSSKEGNNGKFLHRLIYEDFYKISLLEYTDIHHIDGNKLNNDISNLVIIFKDEHSKLHSIGKSPTKETRLKIGKTISKLNNKSGYFRVSKQKANCKQGFTWKYTYYENGKRKAIYSIDIQKLKEKVLSKNLEWLQIIGVEAP